jgi:hypothetical protein
MSVLPVYSDLMSEGTPFIELRINLSDPPDLMDFIGALAAVGNQFESYVAREHPRMQGSARLFVKEIRQGSYVVDLIPHIPALIAIMDAVLIVDNFVTRYRMLLDAFFQGTPSPALPKSDAKDYLNAVKLIAKDKKGSASIRSTVFKQSGSETHIAFEFNTEQAQKAQEILERRMIEHEKPVFELIENVLMVFWQSNLKDPETGKRTGEMVTIEAASPKALALVYGTDLARERIKFETEQGDRNIYRLGFYVDVYVERFQGKPVAYRVTNVREIIPLPDDV